MGIHRWLWIHDRVDRGGWRVIDGSGGKLMVAHGILRTGIAQNPPSLNSSLWMSKTRL